MYLENTTTRGEKRYNKSHQARLPSKKMLKRRACNVKPDDRGILTFTTKKKKKEKEKKKTPATRIKSSYSHGESCILDEDEDVCIIYHDLS